MTYTLTPLTSHQTGAEIRGLDLARPLSDEVRSKLNADFAKYHVLVFRDQKLTPEQLLNAGKIFGEPMRHDERPSMLGRVDMPVYELRNVMVAPGKYQIAGESFHTDHSNHPAPPKATFLHAVELPTSGGDTQFVNNHLAYEDLSAEVKKLISALRAIHVYEGKFSPRKLREVPEEDKRRLPPPAFHPLVCAHPESGGKFLFVCDTRIDGVPGLPEDEARTLVHELMAHATRPKFEYRHKWQYGDAVIWDDRSVLHKANGDYDMRQTRRMYRMMIKGVPLQPGFPDAVQEHDRKVAMQV